MLNISAYLKRINLESVDEANLHNLKLIHRNHLMAIPFENLDIHLYSNINLEPEVLFHKIVLQKRGGICYELNYLLYLLLLELGYKVSLLAGQVFEENGSYFDHLFLKVLIENQAYIADVGFGDNFLEPLLFECNKEQEDKKGLFIIEQRLHNEYALMKINQSDKSLAYTFIDVDRRIDEYRERMEWFVIDSESLFRQNYFCSLEKEDGRLSLKQDKFIITYAGNRQEIPIDNLSDYYKKLKELFGINLTDKEVKTLSFDLTNQSIYSS